MDDVKSSLKKKTVVIIGGGICGLSCARELSMKFSDSINVIVLEASNRLGKCHYMILQKYNF